MRWQCPGEDMAVKMVILSDDMATQALMKQWVKEREVKVRLGVWMWWKDTSRSDDGSAGAAAVCKHTDSCRAFLSNLGTE